MEIFRWTCSSTAPPAPIRLHATRYGLAHVPPQWSTAGASLRSTKSAESNGCLGPRASLHVDAALAALRKALERVVEELLRIAAVVVPGPGIAQHEGVVVDRLRKSRRVSLVAVLGVDLVRIHFAIAVRVRVPVGKCRRRKSDR